MVRPRSHWTGENPFKRLQVSWCIWLVRQAVVCGDKSVGSASFVCYYKPSKKCIRQASQWQLFRHDNNYFKSWQREATKVADIGDVRANLYNLTTMADEVTSQYEKIFRWGQSEKKFSVNTRAKINHYHLLFLVTSNDCVPISLGGDHLISYPILR